MENLDSYIEANFDRFISELADLCRIPSVSAQNQGLQECAKSVIGHLHSVGLEGEIIPMGGPDNPPLVYARLDVPGAKRTLLIYGHFDVQPPEPLEEWNSPPFEPEIRNGRLYGRGTGDNKGQFFAHLKAIEALRSIGEGVPMNLRILLDPQEEIGSPMLERFVTEHATLFRADFGYNADGSMGEGDVPMLSFGNRGVCCVEVRVKEGRRDVHSGQFGGPMPNAAWRLVDFLKTLRDETGRVAIRDFYENVLPPDDTDRAAMEAIPFDAAEWLREMGVSLEDGPAEWSHLEKIMFQPTLSINGLSAGYGGEGPKTVIPCEAVAKIDMRLVKNQTPSEIHGKFVSHVRRHGFDEIEIIAQMQYHPSKTPIGLRMSQAVIGAVRDVFGREPLVYPVTGGSNPSYIFNELCGIPIVKVPYANFDESNHAPNENLRLDFFRMGIMTTAQVIRNLGRL